MKLGDMMGYVEDGEIVEVVFLDEKKRILTDGNRFIQKRQSEELIGVDVKRNKLLLYVR